MVVVGVVPFISSQASLRVMIGKHVMALTKAEKVTCLLGYMLKSPSPLMIGKHVAIALAKAENTRLLGYAKIALTTVDPPSRLAFSAFLVLTRCRSSACMTLLLSFMNMPPPPMPYVTPPGSVLGHLVIVPKSPTLADLVGSTRSLFHDVGAALRAALSPKVLRVSAHAR